MPEFEVRTKKSEELVDITGQVSSVVSSSKLKSGICLVYVPHTSAAIIINEGWDSGIKDDLLLSLSRIVPKNEIYKHNSVDGNADAHIKSALLGPSEMLAFHEGKLVLGQWQAILLCEFDGPRSRKVIVEMIGR